MDFIKAKYDKVILVVAALLLLASAAFIFLGTTGFKDAFAQFLQAPVQSKDVPPLSLDPINTALQTLQQPAKWGVHTGSLFVGNKYVVTPNGGIQRFGPEGEDWHPPVKNIWFFDNHLDGIILQSDALEQDQDNDKFTNLEEWKGKTDPNDPKSHPPFTDKLRLSKAIFIPFRIVFSSRPDNDTYVINSLDSNRPSQFLKMGDVIEGTAFKLEKFEEKSETNKLGIPEDISELTIKNQTTGEVVILPIKKTINSPDVYAEFKYLLDNSVFTKKKDQDFQLKPDEKTTYKLIDIKPTEAHIKNLGTNEEITISKM